MKIDRLILGPLQTNCYILSKNNDCIIIDPADDYNLINKYVNNKNIVGILVTHYHFDHIGALENFNKELIFDYSNLKEKNYKLGEFSFDVIYTTGHKEDCITILFKEENVMFTGDFIFKNSIGRVDLPGGNIDEMVNSLKKISKYSKNIKIYPGHSEDTYLGKEIS